MILIHQCPCFPSPHFQNVNNRTRATCVRKTDLSIKRPNRQPGLICEQMQEISGQGWKSIGGVVKYINQCHYRHLMLAAQIHKRLLLMSADTIKGDLIEKLFKIDGLFHVPKAFLSWPYFLVSIICKKNSHEKISFQFLGLSINGCIIFIIFYQLIPLWKFVGFLLFGF